MVIGYPVFKSSLNNFYLILHPINWFTGFEKTYIYIITSSCHQ